MGKISSWHLLARLLLPMTKQLLHFRLPHSTCILPVWAYRFHRNLIEVLLGHDLLISHGTGSLLAVGSRLRSGKSNVIVGKRNTSLRWVRRCDAISFRHNAPFACVNFLSGQANDWNHEIRCPMVLSYWWSRVFSFLVHLFYISIALIPLVTSFLHQNSPFLPSIKETTPISTTYTDYHAVI